MSQTDYLEISPANTARQCTANFAELADYIQYSRFVGSVTDQATQVGRVELAVRSRGGLHLSQ